MSRLHRSASRQMSRPAISIQRQGGWTFGSPSILMMFHRVSGELEKELQEMIDDGKPVEVNCQFCGSHYKFDTEQLKEFIK